MILSLIDRLLRRMLQSAFSNRRLQTENRLYRQTAGVSPNNHHLGWRPAFRDDATGQVVISCWADGSPAPLHTLQGLPDELVLQRDETGQVMAAKPTLTAGFVTGEQFYTREQAARLVSNNN